jgi:hypothetical protein
MYRYVMQPSESVSDFGNIYWTYYITELGSELLHTLYEFYAVS